MAGRAYRDFDIRVDQLVGRKYRVLATSDAGEASVEITRPLIAPDKVEVFVLKIGHPRRDIVRRIDTPRVAAAREFGGRLFAKIFQGEIKARLDSCVRDAERDGHGVRIRLRLPPELADLPWEFMCDNQKQFLALSPTTPVVRYVESPSFIEPLAVDPPIKVLVAQASPKGSPALDTAKEWEQLREALKPLESRGRVSISRLDHTTPSALQRELRKGRYHVFTSLDMAATTRTRMTVSFCSKMSSETNAT
jgi:hypothetical protein